MYFCLIFIIVGTFRSSSSFSPALKINANELKVLESAISNSSCKFYTALEKFVPCGADGYVQKFIYKYCMAYLAESSTFINQAWQNGVRVCLQKHMLTYLQTDMDASCSQIKKHGFDSHTDCYLKPDPDNAGLSFCHLPPQDIVKIIWIAKGSVFEPAVWSQLLQLIKNCAGQTLQG